MSSDTGRYGGLASLTLALMLTLQGCGVSTAKPKAEAAITQFHNLLDADNLDAIWSNADDSLRQASSREKFDKFMQAVHRKLGRVLKTTNTQWFVGNFNLKTTVVLQQKTDFEHGSGTEKFTYVVAGDAVKLVGYNILSDDLVTL